MSVNIYGVKLYFKGNIKKNLSLSMFIGNETMLSGSTVTTAWRVLGLRIEETASRYGG
jgi:hypothetical protein